jgi:hypothetical protein
MIMDMTDLKSPEVRFWLRELHAAAALAGFCTNAEMTASMSCRQIAEMAYVQADAMHTAREEKMGIDQPHTRSNKGN